ncbi:MAG: TonB-dependent receptor [Phycisphaerales bacterium]|nr:TonB-dependent receptor [Phycisphaerales bacterium]MDI9358390.1 TonB-dependent receptor [Phycisphaerales bacterium]
MIKFLHIPLVIALFFFTHQVWGQEDYTIKGQLLARVIGNPVAGATLNIKGTQYGAISDNEGNFSFKAPVKIPFVIEISSLGYIDRTIKVEEPSQLNKLLIRLDQNYQTGEDIVVSASRIKEKLLQSQASIERIGAKAIANSGGFDYYNSLSNFKGISTVNSSLNLTSYSSRGFAGIDNYRLNQFYDGMDNSSAALNYPLATLISSSELDVDNIEFLPGAASALYGSGGTNGTILITSKDPFKSTGFSFIAKQAINNVGIPAVNDYVNRVNSPSSLQTWEARYAHKFGDKLAFKIGVGYTTGRDWQSTDSTDIGVVVNPTSSGYVSKPGGTRANDPNYNGLNVYGDEVSLGLQSFAQATRTQVMNLTNKIPNPLNPSQSLWSFIDATIAQSAVPGSNYQAIYSAFQTLIANLPAQYQALGAQLLSVLPSLLATANPGQANPFNVYGNQSVSRNGYDEKYLQNYKNYNLKANASIYYNITPKLQLILEGAVATFGSASTAGDRFSLQRVFETQDKIELKSDDWFARVYTNNEVLPPGYSYGDILTASGVNNAWKSNTTWFSDYSNLYFVAKSSGVIVNGVTITNLTNQQADEFARYGTLNGQKATANLTGANLPTYAQNGAIDPNSQQFRNYFDSITKINIQNGGAGISVKSAFYDASGQYDFKKIVKVVSILIGGNFRVYRINSSGTYFNDALKPITYVQGGAFVELKKSFFNELLNLTGIVRYDKNQNFKGRFTPRVSASLRVAPNQFLRFSFQTGYRFPSNQDQYINLRSAGAYQIGGLQSVYDYYNFKDYPIYTSQSVQAYRDSFTTSGKIDPSLLKVLEIPTLKPESSISFEVGYRAALVEKRLLIDVYGYFTRYTNLITRYLVGVRAAGDPTKQSAGAKDSALLNSLSSQAFSLVSNSPTPINTIGFGVSAQYTFPYNYLLSLNVTSDQQINVPANLFTYYNAAPYQANLSISNINVWHNIGFGLTLRWQDAVDFQSSFANGLVPAYTTLDGYLSYHFPSIKSIIKIGGSNLVNKYYKTQYGGVNVGGLYYASFAFNVL